MRQEDRGGLIGGVRVLSPRVVWAVASADIVSGGIVTASGAPLKVAPASDGGAVYGVALSDASADRRVQVIVEGEALLNAKTTASWTTHRRVCAAGSNEVDEGSAGDPYFATLISHDTTNNKARVFVHSDAAPRVGRALIDAAEVVWPIDTLTSGRDLIASGGKITAPVRSGNTASRPGGTPVTGQRYFDTTVGEEFIYDGTRWRSSATHALRMAISATTISTANLTYLQALSTADTILPWVVERACRVCFVHFSVRGSTGGIAWTLRLRKNGSGSDTWTSTARSSVAATWVSNEESIDEALAQGDRITVLADTGGSTETVRIEAHLAYYYT